MLIPAIVAAAGPSTRCPGGKLLVPYHGKPLLQWLLSSLSEHPGVGRILVVTGHQRADVEALLYPYPKTRSVHNPQWQRGLASSLQLGVASLPPTPGFLVTLGDRPFFQTLTLDRILPSSNEQSHRIRVPQFDGENGYPMYFPAASRPDWRGLRGEAGADDLLRLWSEQVDRVPVHDRGVLRDVDQAEDFPEAETLQLMRR